MLRAALVMSKASRHSKSEARLAQLETEFVEKLVIALRECEAGRWGLFGQNDQVFSVRGGGPKSVNCVPNSASFRVSTPYQRFLHYRAMRGPNTPGEPKLATLLLREIDRSGCRERANGDQVPETHERGLFDIVLACSR